MSAKTILLVDDSATHLHNLREAVSGIGARVITATDGAEAVEKAKTELPDIIFMDIVMDGLDGFGACREITRNEGTKDIPIIFVSTKNQRADKMWAEKQGAKGLISKPFSQSDITDQINLYC